MRVKLWGVRGSIPVPGSAAAGFGGNTSCVQVTTERGTELILDAGSGIRELGHALVGRRRPIDILVTHLHIDHILGLVFFAPFFDPDAEVTVWGPPAAGRALRERLARYISNPLSPIDIHELPAKVTFRDAMPTPWRISDIQVTASLVAHRGPTLGYRLEADGAALCYLPDHEPSLGQNLATSTPEWISGHGLARRASLLIHDCQYTDDEYRGHRGWGHSSISDALAFAIRCEPGHVQLFHHDPAHDDARLASIGNGAAQQLEGLGCDAAIEMAKEGRVITLAN
ncbi:MAG: MBL fold metallo-hydrolase [Solirubrobacteraceae bacterium]